VCPLTSNFVNPFQYIYIELYPAQKPSEEVQVSRRPFYSPYPPFDHYQPPQSVNVVVVPIVLDTWRSAPHAQPAADCLRPTFYRSPTR
jgi:hypothetical protein